MYMFSIDMRDGNVALSAGAPPSARGTVALQLREISAARHGDEPHRTRLDAAPAGPEFTATALHWAPDSTPAAVIGVVADAGVLDAPFSAILTDPKLFPGVRRLDRLERGDIAVRLRSADGSVLFASGAEPGAGVAIDSVQLRDIGLVVAAELSPRLAGELVASSAPPSQLPTQLLMIVISAALALAGTIQLRRAEALEEARSRFVANVSHELRTPLAQISMFAETLSLGRERSPAEARQFAMIIHGEARRLTHLAESVLRFSRREKANALAPEAVDAAVEVTEAAAAFAPIAAATEAVIELRQLDGGACFVDRGALRQILLNLLDNAVKHGGRGTRVAMSIVADERQVRIIVDDTGPGIPAAWRERVFGAYVKVDRSNNSGAGIGLSIVRDLVRASNGEVRIEDSPLGGARFVILLPAARHFPETTARPAVVGGAV
jgi:signal transduction histidine kinase